MTQTDTALAPIASAPLRNFLSQHVDALTSALSQHPLRLAEFAIALDNACAQEPKLVACVQQNPDSVRNAILTAAMLGLRPGPVHKHYALTCFEVRGKPTCVGIPEWRGYVHLANTAGGLDSDIVVDVVYAYEAKPPKGHPLRFRYNRMTGEVSHDLDWDDENAKLRTPDKLVAAYATCQVKGRRGWATVVLPKEQILSARAKSASWTHQQAKSAWTTDTVAMWKKTAIRRLLDGGKVPMSRDVIGALHQAENVGELEAAIVDDEQTRPLGTVAHGEAAPTNPAPGQLWIDTGADPVRLLRFDAGDWQEGITEDEYDHAVASIGGEIQRKAREHSLGSAGVFALIADVGKLDKLPAKLSDAPLGALCRALHDHSWGEDS